MEHNESASNADKIHQNRLSSITEDEDQDAALTIVTVLDKVATIVDSVQASQKRLEERHREMENAIKSVQIDLLKLSQSHSNTGYVINKLFEKTRKVSAHIKDVKARVERQQVHVKNVESKQEEIMKKNKFRVVIFQEEIRCPTSLSIVKDRSLTENQEVEDDVFDPPIDLSSDEEYYVEESKSARLRKSGKERIDNIKKAFSKENMQKTRQNFDKKVNRIRTRIVTPERRERLRQSGERLRQSGERLKQSGERFKKSISNAAPSREAFKMRSLRKAKDQTVAGDVEEVREMGVDIIARSESLGPISEIYTDELSETDHEEARAAYPPREGGEISTPEPLKVTFKPQVKVEDDESLLLDLKQ
ncbi:caveolae-associated protein 4 [Vulpes vulpes]|uniref:Muscle-restricted coiled-coil protein n=4 Tax=Canidae TaxID=9608 RepID=A0A8C0NP85_CANLF|nr:caveolae-associated protein 4 [Canis lupus dingo]XP_025869025.1 caveolae-associated protein 4 [Vulpes vulpes]XP_038408871.1 LOW QUALITY PROTEIN: caveolae-associated protein 4 [Canis lupus familiaris]XP_038538209.1 caveolae-associated protein 4 [Canis lupus familiaris]XP_041620462.1 caveolae-associated protein 4 [Vulpes lagopus]XP_538754.1 caveolae-associated protein 4 [Canis lupus familiaris]|eukprot:XP_538754.1 caveolae-associated protein 4 [Canis lupus familiaris]